MIRRPFTAAAALSLLMAVLLAVGGVACMPRRMTVIPLVSTHFIIIWRGVAYLCDLNHLRMSVPLGCDADLFIRLDHPAVAFAALPLAWLVVTWWPNRRGRESGFPVEPIRQK